MATTKGKKTRERVLQAAQALFQQKGYQGVSIREIARAAGIREASLYYYAPGGKEQLYVEVVRRELESYRQGLTQAIRTASPTAHDQLTAVAIWLLDQPPPPLVRLFDIDRHFLSDEHAQQLLTLATQSLYAPRAHVFRNATLRGEIQGHDPVLLAGQFLASVHGMQHARMAGLVIGDTDQLAQQVVDLFMHGVAKRDQEGI